MNTKKQSKRIAHGALIAALYTALTVMLSPIGFGAVQFRVSEALTLMAIFSPFAASSITLGCFMSNLIGMMMGLTTIWDVIFGTIATAIAAYLSYIFRDKRTKGLPLLSASMPVIVNAIVIGVMISLVYYDNMSMVIVLMNMLSVGIGEFFACFFVGLPLIRVMERYNIDKFYK